MIPAIATERLDMRGPLLADYAHYAAFWRSERSSHSGGPLPDWGIWLQFAAMRGHWEFRGFGLWTLVERSHGQRTLRMGRIISYVAEANHRSQHLAERLGARVAETGDHGGDPFRISLHPAPSPIDSDPRPA